jgi:hypothetical protein
MRGVNSMIDNLSSHKFSDGPLGLTNYGFRFDKAGYLKLGYAQSSLRAAEFDASANTPNRLDRNYFSLDTFFNF